jgi:WD40 repeat protein
MNHEGTYFNIHFKVQFSGDGHYLVWTRPWRGWQDRVTTRVRDLATNTDEQHIDGALLGGGFAPDGRTFYIGKGDDPRHRLSALETWELPDKGGPAVRLKSHALPDAEHVLISPTFDRFASTRGVGSSSDKLPVTVCDLSSGAVLCETTVSTSDYPLLESFQFTRNGRCLFAVCTERPFPGKKILVLDVNARLKPVGELEREAELSPDGKWLALGTESGARLLRIRGLKPHADLEHPGDEQHRSIAGDPEFGLPTRTFSPDSTAILITGLCPPGRPQVKGRDQRVARLWNVETGRKLEDFENCDAGAFSSDGRLLAVPIRGRGIEIWKLDPPRPLPSYLVALYGVWILALVAGLFWLLFIRRGSRSNHLPPYIPNASVALPVLPPS